MQVNAVKGETRYIDKIDYRPTDVNAYFNMKIWLNKLV